MRPRGKREMEDQAHTIHSAAVLNRTTLHMTKPLRLRRSIAFQARIRPSYIRASEFEGEPMAVIVLNLPNLECVLSSGGVS
jgi:hypothetical protein